MFVYRLCKTRYARDISGESARSQRNNRWNSYGVPMLYTAESPALCAVELHQYIPPSLRPLDYAIVTLRLPDVQPVLADDDFLDRPDWIHDVRPSQVLGDAFVDEMKHLVMKVPSAMITFCYNYLINPRHALFHEVEVVGITPFPIEGKLFLDRS